MRCLSVIEIQREPRQKYQRRMVCLFKFSIWCQWSLKWIFLEYINPNSAYFYIFLMMGTERDQINGRFWTFNTSRGSLSIFICKYLKKMRSLLIIWNWLKLFQLHSNFLRTFRRARLHFWNFLVFIKTKKVFCKNKFAHVFVF